MAIATHHCPFCDTAADTVRERREVPLGQRRVTIDDEWTRCGECGEEFYTPEQADQRHWRAIEQARLDDNLLPPRAIRAIRDSLHLTQRQFEQLLGVGEKTCVRWEAGRVCQSVSTDRLIRLIAADRNNLRLLAGINGVALRSVAPTATPFASTAGFERAYEHDKLPVQIHSQLRGTHEPDPSGMDLDIIRDAIRQDPQIRVAHRESQLVVTVGEIQFSRRPSKSRSYCDQPS